MTERDVTLVDQVAGGVAGRNVLVTGHTGFKGVWLAAWLAKLGARVSGYSLEPTAYQAPLFEQIDRAGVLTNSFIGDINDAASLDRAFVAAQPEIVLHLAAQPLVRASYDDPVETFRTNVLGTATVLDAVRRHVTPAVVVVTSDKCYENREQMWPYREIDRMGGRDPYSASKGAAEIVVSSFMNSFFTDGDGPACASARAGNVVGGGDLSPDRLVPDFFRAMDAGDELVIRHPAATRPWQHVLESLSGYLTLAVTLLDDRSTAAGSWNFGPDPADVVSVADFLAALSDHIGSDAPTVALADERGPHEASRLSLDVTKAKHLLGWSPVLSLEQRIELTAEWYVQRHRGELSDDMIVDQISTFEDHWRSSNAVPA